MIKTLKKHLGHDTQPLIQFLKYGIVGGMATAVHIVTFFILGYRLFPCLTANDITVKLLGLTVEAISQHDRAIHALICNVLAFVVSNIFCYVLNRLFVFKPGKHHIVLEFLLFFGVSALSLAVAAALQTVMISKLGVQTTYAFGANILCSLMINYAMRKFVVFKN